MKDTYKTEMESEFFTADNNGDYNYFWDSDPNDYEWRVRTPFRATAGMAFVLDSYNIGGFYTFPMTLSADYEYVDYSRAKLAADDYSFVNENEQIALQYQATQNFRAGAEIRFGFFSLRGGYQIYGSPYKGDSFMTNASTGYTAGFGFSGKHVFLDIAYTLMQKESKYNLYEAQDNYPLDPIGTVYGAEPVADLKQNIVFANLTFGVRF
jgi:hypothetical protein